MTNAARGGAKVNSIRAYAEFANAVYQKGGAPHEVRHYTKISGVSALLPLVAAAYYRQPSDPIIVAYRGSVTEEDWGKADVDVFEHCVPTEYVGVAFEFFSQVTKKARSISSLRKHCGRYAVVGHSLGGALATIVAARITTRPVIAATFNAPRVGGLTHFGQYHEPAASDEKEGGPSNLLLGLTDSGFNWAMTEVARAGSGGGVNALPRANGSNTWHVRLSVDGMKDLVSALGVNLGNLLSISMPESAVIERTRALQLAASIVKLGNPASRLAASGVRRVELMIDAHYMKNVVAALNLPQNSKVAVFQPLGW